MVWPRMMMALVGGIQTPPTLYLSGRRSTCEKPAVTGETRQLELAEVVRPPGTRGFTDQMWRAASR